MQHFVNIVEQMNEAVRFISDGSIAHARMALLLLDNVAEVMLARAARYELAWDDEMVPVYERRRQRVESGAPDAIPDHRRLLTKKQRRDVEFSFDAKAALLVERDRLDAGTAEVLGGLHRHRNDTYHKERLRQPIVRATAILYLELCCDLLVRFGREGGWSMGSEWTDFHAKYELKEGFFFSDDSFNELSARFRKAVGIEDRELASALAGYLEARLDVIEEELDFLDYHEHRDAALQSIQFAAKHGEEWNKRFKATEGPGAWHEYRAAEAKFVPPITTATLQKWRDASAALASSLSPKPELFAAYHQLEMALEPIEKMVDEEASGYDRHIQQEIDRVRGK